MSATLQVLFDANGDAVPETDITAYLVNALGRGALRWNRGTSTTSLDYVASTCSMLMKDPNGDFSPENPNGAFRTVITSFTTAGDTDNVKNATTQQKLAQTFSMANANEVDKVELYLKWTGSTPAGSAYVEIWHTNAGAPYFLYELTAVSRTLTAAQVGTAYGYQAFTFEIPPILAASTTYAIVLQTTGYTYSAGVNELKWASNLGGYASGGMYRYDGASWSSVATDLKFKVSRNDVREGRMVWFKVTESGTDYYAWTGYLRGVTVYPGRQVQESMLLFSDSDDDAKSTEIRLKTRTNYAAESAINEIWTSASPAGLGLSATQVSIGNEDEGIPFWYQQPHADASKVADQICDAFGGRTYWKAVSPANGYRRVVFRSVVADQVESGTAVEDWGSDYMEDDFEYRWNSREAQIINRAIVRANPRKVGVAGVATGRYTGQLPETWAANETRSDIWIDFTDPIVRDSAISPVAGTDITSGFTVNSITEYSHMVQLSITAPSTATALTKLQVRATAYELQPSVTATVEDTLSQAIYGVREWRVDNPYVQNYGRAKSLGQALVRRFRRAYTRPVVKRLGGTTNNWASLAARDIGDRVTLTMPSRINGGYSSSYYIEGLEGEIEVVASGNVITKWEMSYRLRKAQDGYNFISVDTYQVIDVGVVAP